LNWVRSATTLDRRQAEQRAEDPRSPAVAIAAHQRTTAEIHDRVDPVGPARGHRGCDPCAHRVADQAPAGARPHGLEHRPEGLAIVHRPESAIAVAEARQVDREHRMPALGEPWRELPPREGRTREPMHQQEGAAPRRPAIRRRPGLRMHPDTAGLREQAVLVGTLRERRDAVAQRDQVRQRGGDQHQRHEAQGDPPGPAGDQGHGVSSNPGARPPPRG
jgi:hypothetical protein